MGIIGAMAPPLVVDRWCNVAAGESPTLEALRGRVVVLYAFQMLCPGCVLHGTPLAKRLHAEVAGHAGVAGDDLAVIGVHTVFEHHAAMQPVSLLAYLHEFAVAFPVAVDRHTPGDPFPETMRAYEMEGTPTFVVIDREGRVRHQLLGVPDELRLGVELGRLLRE